MKRLAVRARRRRVAFLIVELSLGAIHFGTPKLADPCTTKPAFKGGGIDGEVQRFVLSGLNGAACRLHTTREELVLSFVPAAGTKSVRWDRATIDDALKAGFDQAFKDTEDRGIAGLRDRPHPGGDRSATPLELLPGRNRLAPEGQPLRDCPSQQNCADARQRRRARRYVGPNATPELGGRQRRTPLPDHDEGRCQRAHLRRTSTDRAGFSGSSMIGHRRWGWRRSSARA